MMLQLEVRFYDLLFFTTGQRNVASLMTEFLPGKTAKQIRDKRATASYKRLREVALMHEESRSDSGSK